MREQEAAVVTQTFTKYNDEFQQQEISFIIDAIEYTLSTNESVDLIQTVRQRKLKSGIT